MVFGTKYSRLEDEEKRTETREEQEDGQEEGNPLLTYEPTRQKQIDRTHRALHWTTHVLLTALCAISFLSRPNQLDEAQRTIAADYTPMWSPAMTAVEGTGHFVRFDGSFARPNEYKGKPSPDIEKSWNRITVKDRISFSITDEVLNAVNASKEYSVKLPESMGGGYMASVEVLHQLHCLNMLREATYEDYYQDKPEQWQHDPPEIRRHHLDHCIDILRQKLMCDADTGILTFNWVKGHSSPLPDFNVQHKCRNFESVLDWVNERSLPMESGDLARLPGSKQLESLI